MRLRWMLLLVAVVACNDKGPGSAPAEEAAPAASAGALTESTAATRTAASEGGAGGTLNAPANTGEREASVPRGPRACPDDMALVAGKVCVDRWEASLVNEDGTDHSPYRSVGAKKVRAQSRAGVVPQAYISAGEAELACKRSDKYLCTTEEWLLACEGKGRGKRTYPYGAKHQAGACNTARREHPVSRLFGKHETDSVSLNNPKLNQLDETVSKTGEFESCASPDGIYDLVGNLLEWTASRYVRPLAMGGHYLDETENGKGCAYVTSAHGPEYHDFTTGFRCCKKPDRAALVAAAALATTDSSAAASVAMADPSAKGALAGSATQEDRDPPGMRGFLRASGTLPDVSPPAYEPANAACPVDMVEIKGTRCAEPKQQCKRWLPRLSVGQKIACAEFAEPSSCEGQNVPMRYCIDRYEFQPEGYAYPITHVNWTEAQNLCGKMDKRLCYENEWEFACEGEAASPYPYGYVRDGKRCNHDFPEEQLVSAPDVFIDHRVARDALSECKSPFGVFNLVGNVDEWTTRQGSDKRSILRGGWWLIGRNRCRAATDNHGEVYAGMQTGFRCCKGAR
ncbi:MAG: SUMF1/EgtB/PvdO family nonheme iron enzyme [Polyangiaceae bacterium]